MEVVALCASLAGDSVSLLSFLISFAGGFLLSAPGEYCLGSPGERHRPRYRAVPRPRPSSSSVSLLYTSATRGSISQRVCCTCDQST